jgi:hypothetical protein
MASLHTTLTSIDGSQPSIHAAAAAMMRHYDKSPGVAVNEWRNCLYATKSSSKLLPLLYICNEVLQNSKRNRGTKFLEAFSPVLGQALQHVCQQDASIVEKVRRTAKIWGDRAVYSPRFIAELLQGLEPFRHGHQPPLSGGAFSPASPQQGLPDKSDQPPSNNVTPSSPSIDDLLAPDNPSSPSDGDGDDHDDDGNDDDEDDVLLGDSSTSFLQVTIDATRIQDHDPKRKRRLHRKKVVAKRRRKSVLSTTSLMDLWNQVTSLQQSFETSRTILAGIHDDHLTTQGTDQLVGDDLAEAYSKVREYQALVQNEQVQLHKIAQGKRAVEREAIRYIHWCRSALLQDAEDLDHCNKLEEELKQLIPFHAKAKLARDERRAKEQIAAAKANEERQRLQELEERKKLLEAAMKKQDVAEEGMVWNPTTQEYQYLNTNEDWRN